MQTITEQLSKVNAYFSSVKPALNLCDSKVATVALTALSLVASAFSYFTLPHVISYTLVGISVLAVAATAFLFPKINQKTVEVAEKVAAAPVVTPEVTKPAAQSTSWIFWPSKAPEAVKAAVVEATPADAKVTAVPAKTALVPVKAAEVVKA
jgi:hypothetical protein